MRKNRKCIKKCYQDGCFQPISRVSWRFCARKGLSVHLSCTCHKAVFFSLRSLLMNWPCDQLRSLIMLYKIYKSFASMSFDLGIIIFSKFFFATIGSNRNETEGANAFSIFSQKNLREKAERKSISGRKRFER